MFAYLKSLIQTNTGHSSKSFALVISAIVGGLLAACVGFCIIYDVVIDGIVDTNLDELGWFLLCIGVYSFGSGAGKVITDTFSKKESKKAVDDEVC